MIRITIVLAGLLAGGIAAADESAPRFSGEAVVTGSIGSSTSIPDESATAEVKPLFGFQCQSSGDGSLLAVIHWQRFISSFNTDVSFNVDDKKRLWLKFGVDDSNQVTTAKSAADTATLLDYLAGGGSLTVGVTPYSEAAVSVEFCLDSLPALLEKLRQRCGG